MRGTADGGVRAAAHQRLGRPSPWHLAAPTEQWDLCSHCPLAETTQPTSGELGTRRVTEDQMGSLLLSAQGGPPCASRGDCPSAGGNGMSQKYKGASEVPRPPTARSLLYMPAISTRPRPLTTDRHCHLPSYCHTRTSAGTWYADLRNES